MSDIEAEIRRQMLEERDHALRNEAPSPSGANPSLPPSSAAPSGPAFHSLPPPASSQAGSYPPPYGQQAYPPYTPPSQPTSLPPPRASAPPRPEPKAPPRKGVAGALGAIGIALAKFWGAIKGLLVGLKFLSIGKYLLTAGSMAISILAWSAAYGTWRMGVGVVALIFLHELGHVIAAKRLGHQVTAMVFVPFLGAYVQRARAGTPTETAQIAIMGPVAGMLAGLACGSVYGMTGSVFWLALAWLSFYMNLFNLSGIPFLDGGRVIPLIEPKTLLGGMIVIALLNHSCPLSWLMILFALPSIVERWKLGVDPALNVSKQDQQNYTLVYLFLLLFLGYASVTTQEWIHSLLHLQAHRF